MSSTKGGKARYKVKHGGGGGGAGANSHKSQQNTSSTEPDDDDVTEPTTVIVDPATTTTTTTTSSSSSKTNGDGDHEANGDADTESANGTNSNSNTNSNGIMANLNHVPTPKNATKKRQPSSSGSTTHVEIQGSVPEKVSGFEQLAEQLARGGVANPTLAAAALMSGGSLSGSTGHFDMSVISGVVPTAATASGSSSLQTNNSSLAHSNLVAANSSAVYTSTSNSSTSVGSVSSSSSSSYSLNSSLPSSASTLVTLPDLSSFSEADRQRIASIQQKLKEKYKNMQGEAADAEVEKLTAALVEELTRSAVQGANGDSAVPAPSTTGESPSRLLVGASFVAVATMTSVLFAAELAKTIVRRGR